MVQKRLLALIVLFALLSGIERQVNPVQAKPARTPLVFLMKGDLFTWFPSDSKPTQITRYGYNYTPVIAPDGTRVAYQSLADFAAPADKNQAGKPEVYAYSPQNIWVLDLATGQAKKVGPQPTDVKRDPAKPGWHNALLRSKPTWSPDSKKLAWVEATLPDYTYRLVIYDLATDTRKTIVPSLPPPYDDAGARSMINPEWLDIGLGMVVSNGARAKSARLFLLVDAQGKTIANYPVPATYGAAPTLWLSDEGQTRAAFLDNNRQLHLVNFRDQGEEDAGSAILELHNLSAGINAAFTVLYRQTENKVSWSVADKNNVETPLQFTEMIWGDYFRLALDPVGQSIAYTTSEGIWVWTGSSSSRIGDTSTTLGDSTWPFNGTLAWSTVRWQLRIPDAG